MLWACVRDRSAEARTLHYNEAQKSVSNQPADPHISIRINGETLGVPPGLNVRELLVQAGLDPARVAVELNREIVRKDSWESTEVRDGATVEIVTFVGGG
ncbi:MAG: sulfur carrier protein ThiS [Candidatus Solibacter usitatus]|nr:sulfur carrier protein ThiS [Candidatus Solibacter usitatus]